MEGRLGRWRARELAALWSQRSHSVRKSCTRNLLPLLGGKGGNHNSQQPSDPLTWHRRHESRVTTAHEAPLGLGSQAHWLGNPYYHRRLPGKTAKPNITTPNYTGIRNPVGDAGVRRESSTAGWLTVGDKLDSEPWRPAHPLGPLKSQHTSNQLQASGKRKQEADLTSALLLICKCQKRALDLQVGVPSCPFTSLPGEQWAGGGWEGWSSTAEPSAPVLPLTCRQEGTLPRGWW